jgi:hypothetical protein
MAPLFARMQAADFKGGRPSIPPRGAAARLVVESFYSVRS